VRITAPGRREALASGVVRRVLGGTSRVRIRVRRAARDDVRRLRVLAVRATTTDERGRRSVLPRALRLRR
jgi:hypothetical protein